MRMAASDEVVARVLERRRSERTYLLQILREIQEELGWISPAIRNAVAAGLKIAPTAVDQIVQFYSFLYDRPVGRYRILFSDNITDRMLGNVALIEHMLKRFKLQRGGVSADGAVSVDFTSCTGMCDHGPAVIVNNRAITRLTPRRVDEIGALVRDGWPLSEWPSDYFRVDDNIRRAETLLTPLASATCSRLHGISRISSPMRAAASAPPVG
jgi:[NiFe] hydrogenase diaphorase moiety large subunit